LAASDAPTSPIGSLGGGIYTQWNGVFDLTETVPDLTWPLSNITYSRMRRDLVLTSVLAAYVLPIMKAH
jgi:hypothetical protein